MRRPAVGIVHLSWTATAAADRADNATIAVRPRFFGPENVDATDGKVNKDRVIFSWVTDASLAVSLEGRIVLLDTYILRLECRRLQAKRICADRRSMRGS